VDVTDASFAEDVLASELPVVVDFWAPWCRPCKAVDRVLTELAAEDPRFRLVRMNLDENVGVPSRYGVLALPTVILFAGGEPRETLAGPHSRGRYETAFAPYLDPPSE
jgi:thioredoxin 1